MSEIKVRTVPMLLSPFVELGRQFGDILRNPTAFFGSLLGSALLTGGVAALVMFGPTFEVSAEEDDDELEMEFMPGELVRLGPKLDPTEIPEKIIVEKTVAAEQAAETTVTTDEKAKPTTEPKKNEPKKNDTKSTEKPDPNKRAPRSPTRIRTRTRPTTTCPRSSSCPAIPSALRTAGPTPSRKATRGLPRS
ncbi:hypothetical protein [Nannocystis pusilla]|uniref:hypothetical protein n=1 Tax=Nannocystis pusilla TaxID=889268 RepID=UPI003B75F084